MVDDVVEAVEKDGVGAFIISRVPMKRGSRSQVYVSEEARGFP